MFEVTVTMSSRLLPGASHELEPACQRCTQPITNSTSAGHMQGGSQNTYSKDSSLLFKRAY